MILLIRRRRLIIVFLSQKLRQNWGPTIPLKENILEEQEQLHDVKVECFMEIQKMDEK